ncbi:MAG: hypothetical protein O7D91_21520 [Planctomycetota bacterium]|nr:hypothetical protein [Planctomycetota bacterium]
MRTDQLRYEPDWRPPVGYWTCPECGDYSGISIPEHRPNCRLGIAGAGFEHYHFGPVEVNQVQLVGHSIGGLTLELYSAWLAEGNERPDLGELDVEAMLRDEEDDR